MLKQIQKKIRTDYLMVGDSQLHETLMQCYEKVYMDIGTELGRYYSSAVCTGLLVWINKPEHAGLSASVDDIIMDIFDGLMKEKYPQLVEKHFSRLEDQTAEILRRELLREGWEPDTVQLLEQIPMKGFSYYWKNQAALYIREEVVQMVEEFNFWELLEDVPHLPRIPRMKFRSAQLTRLRDPLHRQLLEDRVKLSLRFLGKFREHQFGAMYCNQLRLSLTKWEKTI